MASSEGEDAAASLVGVDVVVSVAVSKTRRARGRRPERTSCVRKVV